MLGEADGIDAQVCRYWQKVDMRIIFGKLATPNWYPAFCRFVVGLGWLPAFLGQPLIHGGSLVSVTFGIAGVVIGGYCSLELVRLNPAPWYKSPSLIGCIVYGFLVAASLYYAMPLIPRLFTE